MQLGRSGGLWLLTAVLVAMGCDADSAKVTSFESELTGYTPSSTEPMGLPTGNAIAPDTSTDSGVAASGFVDTLQDAPANAEIRQRRGDRLYTLSTLAGLSIIDVSSASAPRLIGRYRKLHGTPFQLEVRDGTAVAIYNDDNRGNAGQLLTLDVSDPANVTLLDELDLGGRVREADFRGDFAYVAAFEEGHCWTCAATKLRTFVVSLNLSDPRNVSKIDERYYDDTNWGPRSVLATTDHIYVAAPESGEREPSASTIHVLDTTDLSGQLTEITTLTVRGQIDRPWQLDEYEGVLRVVTSPSRWYDGRELVPVKPAIETFAIAPSGAYESLARSEIDLGEHDMLNSVRFDGERAYVRSLDQSNVLLTLDLSDPRDPKQAATLELPSSGAHVATYGHRLLSAGIDDLDLAAGITVVLFDVADLSMPRELSRVTFGRDKNWLARGLPRVDDARTLQDAGLILVPYAARPAGAGACYVEWTLGGLQLIELVNDELRLRGDTPGVSAQIESAWLLNDTLLTAAADRVEAFDITDGAAPKESTEVVLASEVLRAIQLSDDLVARIRRDRAGTYNVDFVTRGQVDDHSASYPTLDLTQIITRGDFVCSTHIHVVETFVSGSRLEILYEFRRPNEGPTAPDNEGGLLVIDASDPAAPKLVSDAARWNSGAWGTSNGPFNNAGGFGYAKSLVRTSHALAVMEELWDDSYPATARHQLRVIDLRDLDDVKSNVLSLPRGTVAGVHIDNNQVLTSHFEPTSPGGLRGRFYVDPFELSDPAAPNRLAKINVPGRLLAFDADSGSALTSEQIRSAPQAGISAADCAERFANASWQPGTRPTDGSELLGECIGFQQRLHLVRVKDGVAELQDQLDLDDDKQIFALSRGDGVLFASVSGSAILDNCAGLCGAGGTPEVIVLGGVERGQLLSQTLELPNLHSQSDWPAVYAHGKRTLIVGARELVIIDVSELAAPRVITRQESFGSIQYAELHEDSALLTLGSTFGQSQQAVRVIPLEAN
jgi:hypothetical protein